MPESIKKLRKRVIETAAPFKATVEAMSGNSQYLKIEVKLSAGSVVISYYPTTGNYDVDSLVAFCQKAEAEGRANTLFIPEYSKFPRNAFLSCMCETVVLPDEITRIEEGSFANFKRLTNISIPDSVIYIAPDAFRNCISLKSITIPANVRCIGTDAFRHCDSLESVTICNESTDIWTGAFFNCPRVTEVNYPKGIEWIEMSRVFKDSPWSIIDPALKKVTKKASKGLMAIKDQIESAIGNPEVEAKVEAWDKNARIEVKLAKGSAVIGFYPMAEDFDAKAFATIYHTAVDEDREKTLYIPSDAVIPESAYEKCSFDNIVISEGIKAIGKRAFKNPKSRSLRNVKIPSSVTHIGDEAFSGWGLLQEVVLPEGLKEIGDSAFSHCPKLHSINLPEGLTEIANFMFTGCSSLQDITLPKSVTQIGVCAFTNTSLQSIELPKNLKVIYSSAFSGTKLQSIELPAKMIELHDALFARTELQSIEIPEGWTEIAEGLFTECRNLQSVKIPDSVTKIGQEAFSDCSKLKSINLPDSVTEIGWRTFYGCEELQTIDLPKNLVTLGGSLFSKCKSLTRIDGLPDSMEVLLNGMFDGCCALTTVSLPKNLKRIGVAAFRDCKSLQSICLPEGLTEIGDEAFEYSGLTSIDLPASVISVGYQAFYECENLRQVNIGNKDVTFDSNALKDCTSLESVNYPDKMSRTAIQEIHKTASGSPWGNVVLPEKGELSLVDVAKMALGCQRA